MKAVDVMLIVDRTYISSNYISAAQNLAVSNIPLHQWQHHNLCDGIQIAEKLGTNCH